ncbi:MAG: sigma-E processing peptidase SpoIIGA [Lachnospiraceae bacterium]
MYLFYPDVYMLMQWIFFVFSLKVASLICRTDPGMKRICGISFLSAAIETLCLIYIHSFFTLNCLLHTLLVPLSIAAVYRPVCKNRLGKEWLSCYGATCILYGVLQWLYNETGYSGVLPTVIGSLLLYFLLRFLLRERALNMQIRNVELIMEEQRLELMGFVDSGNLLYDPIWGNPVSVADKETLEPLFHSCDRPVILIPFHTTSGSNLMQTIVVDELRIFADDTWHVVKNARIGAAPTDIFKGKAYQLLIHQEHIRT